MKLVVPLYVTAGIVLLNILAKVIYNVFFSPLSRVPGPWYTPVTGLPTRLATTVLKRQAHHCHNLHSEYGPYVRIAPNEVLVSDPAAFKQIHKIGTHFRKTDMYKYLNPTKPGVPPYGLFQVTDSAQHAAARKMLAHGFTKNYLRSEWERTVHEKIDLLFKYMKQEAKLDNGRVDLVKWLPLWAGDVIATLMFGESFDMLGKQQPDPMLANAATASNMLAYAFPMVYAILRRIPHPKLRALFSGNQILLQRGKIAVENSKASSSSRNVFSKVLADAEKDDPSTRMFSDEEVIIQAGTFIFAGTDTTATTLMYLIWSVLRDPALHKVLEEEVSTLDELYNDEKLETLPALNAVIKETLRLYGAAPAALPRLTPREGVVLGGYTIPAGTIVATQAWSLHRDPSVFTDPDKFDYTRWLDPDFAASEKVKAVWGPFGAGSRICIGLHLAQMELRLGAAAFFRRCKGAKLAKETTDASMEVENIFLIKPKGHACKVIISTD